MERTDLELIQAVRGGNAVAADELVRRHLSRVRNVVFQMVLDHDAADDLTQEVFTRALTGLEAFNGRSSLTTWLHRIALNVACGFLRRSDRRKTVALPMESVDEGLLAPDATIIETEGKDRIAGALGRLNPTLRAAIVLTVMQGFSALEAAEIEACSLGTMYWRIHEARRRLREDLKDWIE